MKVFGNGFLATLIKENIINHKYHFYARGISNSIDLTDNQIDRDLRELNQFLEFQNNPFFYLSSSDNSQINKLESKYFMHKENCEKLVLESKYGKILRIPQIVGNKKSKTALLNYFSNKLLNNQKIIIHKGRLRYPILGSTIIECLHQINNYFNPKFRIIDIRPLYGIKTDEIISIMSNNFNIEPKLTVVDKYEFNPLWSREVNYLNNSFSKLQSATYCKDVVQSYCRNYIK